MGVFTSHHCGLGSILRLSVIFGLSLSLVRVLSPRFPIRVIRFFPPQKPTLHFQSDQETVEPFNGKYTAIFPQDFWQIIFSARSLNHCLETTKIKGPYARHTGTSFRQRNTYVGALESLKAPPGAVCAKVDLKRSFKHKKSIKLLKDRSGVN